VARLLGQRSKFRNMDVSCRSRAKVRNRELGLVSRVHMLMKLECGFAFLDLALAGEGRRGCSKKYFSKSSIGHFTLPLKKNRTRWYCS
jgi:hypothetical protein